MSGAINILLMAGPLDDESNVGYLVLLAMDSSRVVRIYSPSLIADNIPAERETVNRALSELVNLDLVEKVGRGKYRITRRGRAYLEGELDASQLSESG